MPLAAGQTLSFYEILRPLGAGGMGEVYLARDTRLEREVAIKVLPEELADDEERLKRFEREAKTLASLNHPNVAGIHTVDQQGEVCFLALELVPGEDLATRLARGPLSVGEALDVCRQIAEGLEAAHEAGVVHRDLKPANVRITPEGVVKLLDFGLAKPIRPKTSREGTSTAESDSFLMTEDGLVLGTPTYMSPEQARGKPVDRRTDLWAFGCVLYECLTGRRAFGGESLTDVLASIVGDEPDWSRLPALPARAEELLRRALTKDPRRRLRDAGEARVQLELAQSEPAGVQPAAAGAGRAGRSRAAAWAGALGLVAGGALGYLARGAFVGVADGTADAEPAAPQRLFVRLEELPPEELEVELALSPDGTRLAWTQLDGIHLRHLDALSDTLLVGSDREDGRWDQLPRSLAWSPDGRELAYSSGDALWRVPADGGPPVRIAREPDAPKRSDMLVWSEQGLVYAKEQRLVRLSPTGGEPATFLELDPEETEHLDGLALLPADAAGAGEEAGILLLRHRAGADDPDTIAWLRDGVPQDVLQLPGWDLVGMRYVPGRLLLERRVEGHRSLWSVPFSPRTGVAGRDPQLFADGATAPGVAGDGSLAYVQQTGQTLAETVWVDLQGAVVPFGRRHEAEFLYAVASHDERQVFSSGPPLGGTIWSYDLERGVSTPVCKLDYDGLVLAGTLPDGRLLVSNLADRETFAYSRQAPTEPERITAGVVTSVSPDGTKALVGTDISGSRVTIQTLDLASGELTPFRTAIQSSGPPTFSPDGRFVLFSSSRTGRPEVHLTSFPAGDREWPVSTDGGQAAWFDATGHTIYFLRGGPPTGLHQEAWRVSLETQPEVRLGVPERMFELEDDGIFLTDFLPGQERFVGSRRLQPVKREIVLRRGWVEER